MLARAASSRSSPAALTPERARAQAAPRLTTATRPAAIEGPCICQAVGRPAAGRCGSRWRASASGRAAPGLGGGHARAGLRAAGDDHAAAEALAPALATTRRRRPVTAEAAGPRERGAGAGHALARGGRRGPRQGGRWAGTRVGARRRATWRWRRTPRSRPRTGSDKAMRGAGAARADAGAGRGGHRARWVGCARSSTAAPAERWRPRSRCTRGDAPPQQAGSRRQGATPDGTSADAGRRRRARHERRPGDGAVAARAGRAAAPARCMALAVDARCGATTMRVASLDDVERVRATDATQDAAALAPEAYARAEQERDFALDAHAAGDDVAAKLHAQRAMAAYGHAVAVARLARADRRAGRRAEGARRRDGAGAGAGGLARQARARGGGARASAREIARSRLLPAASGDASPSARPRGSRPPGRWRWRRGCSAARRVSSAPDADGARRGGGRGGQAGRTAPLGRLARHRGRARAESIDAAGLARARCLDVLTRARRAAGRRRRRRGRAALRALGERRMGPDARRARRRRHPARRVPGHQADRRRRGEARETSAGSRRRTRASACRSSCTTRSLPRPKDESDARRADAAVKALVAGGAAAARVKAELAGARAPAVDPGDARLRARNERHRRRLRRRRLATGARRELALRASWRGGSRSRRPSGCAAACRGSSRSSCAASR